MPTIDPVSVRGRPFATYSRWQLRLRTVAVLVAVIALVCAGATDWANREARIHHLRTEIQLQRYIAELDTHIATTRTAMRGQPVSDRNQGRLESVVLVPSEATFANETLESIEGMKRVVLQRVEQEVALKIKFQRRLLWSY